MREEWIKPLKEAISEVLETMCFLCPVPVEPHETFNLDEEDPVSTEIHFRGSGGGTLRIEFSKGLASLIVESFLGEDHSQMDDEQRRDTLREITNMIGGNLLQRIDPGGRLTLSVPSLCPPSAVPTRGRPQLAMDVEGHALRVFVEEPREEHCHDGES